jgi:hypothetical protein
MYTSPLHQGYLDALYGKDQDPEQTCSEYEEGYIVGLCDRDELAAGTQPPKFLGCYREDDLPIKRGQEVIIPKGTMVKVVGKPAKPAGRTYKITVAHVNSGNTFYVKGSAFRKEYIRPTSPKVVWPGTGGYWAEADLNDILKANP